MRYGQSVFVSSEIALNFLKAMNFFYNYLFLVLKLCTAEFGASNLEFVVSDRDMEPRASPAPFMTDEDICYKIKYGYCYCKNMIMYLRSY